MKQPDKPNDLQELFDSTEKCRIEATETLNPGTQKSDGQFFTPMALAKIIASTLEVSEQESVRILDPGAGIGSLTVALVGRILLETKIRKIEIVAIEKDALIVPFLENTLHELKSSASHLNGEFKYQILNDDFFNIFTMLGSGYKELDTPFDLVIMNPPYGKISNQSPERIACRNLGVDCSNLYSGFVTFAIRLLKKDGSLAAITPRSFMNGPYFFEFREDFLNNLNLKRIHMFDSRSSLFADTGVLQENVIFSGIKQAQRAKVKVTNSKDHITGLTSNTYPFEQIVLPGDTRKFIRLPSDARTQEVISLVESLPSTLANLGLSVSTGRVVDFRVKEFLHKPAQQDQVPLIYPGNFVEGTIQWPLEIRKPQSMSSHLEALLLPNEVFVLIKRFSSKEERKRIVAAVWDPAQSKSKFVGFENHLNVIHSNNLGLRKDLALGLSYWLNGSLVDTYFRVFSGHTQVNATDLRSMKFPTLDVLCKIGKGKSFLLPDQNSIDAEISEHLAGRTLVA